jgi:hypothetical protein
MTGCFCKSNHPDELPEELTCHQILTRPPMSQVVCPTALVQFLCQKCEDPVMKGGEPLSLLKGTLSGLSYLSHSPVCTSRRCTSLYSPCSTSMELDMAPRQETQEQALDANSNGSLAPQLESAAIESDRLQKLTAAAYIIPSCLPPLVDSASD